MPTLLLLPVTLLVGPLSVGSGDPVAPVALGATQLAPPPAPSPAPSTPGNGGPSHAGEAQDTRTPVPDGDRILAAVPGDAAVVAVTAPFDLIRARCERNAWSRFQQREIFAPIVAAYAPDGMDWRGWARAQAPDWLDPGALLDAIHGRVAFFVTPEEHPVLGLLVEPGRPNESFLAQLDGLRGALDDTGRMSFELHEGVEVAVAALDEAGEEYLAIFEAGGLVGVFGGGDALRLSDVVEGAIRRARAPSDGGFDRAEVRTAVASGAPKSVEFFVAIQPILRLAGADMDAEQKTWLRVLGVDRMRWFYVASDVGVDEETSFEMRVHLPSGGLFGDLAGYLRRPSRDLLRLMPREAHSVSLLNYDLWGAYEHVTNFLSENDPEAYDEMQKGMDSLSTMTGFDIEGDLLSQFTGSVGIFTMSVPPEEIFGQMGLVHVDESVSQAETYLVELEDAGAVEEVVERLLEIGGMGHMVDYQDFADYTVQTLSRGPLPFTWAFTDDLFVFSPSPSSVRMVLDQIGRDDSTSALDNERFMSVVETLGTAACVSVTDSKTAAMGLLGGLNLFRDFGLLFLPPEAKHNAVISSMGRIAWPPPAAAAEYFKGTISSRVERRGDTLSIVVETR